ncbi:MAG: ABC transporter permease [Candidatus Thorarchaeota archaeon]|nr:MAG: ABC transporter permease [Candidatus Thorarchaeota archaeon]
MNQSLRTIKACFIKELRVCRRTPQKLVLVILLPLMFFMGFSMLMGGVYYGEGVATALVIEEQNPGIFTDGFIEILDQYDEIPPRLNPIPMDAETADRLFQNGEILLVITIPEGFENALANNLTTSIIIQVANIHEDLTKNLRMPVIRKVDLFYQKYLLNDSFVDFEMENLRAFTPPRLAYMGLTIAVYGIMFSAIFLAGSTVTQEFEQKTLDEITLAGRSPYAIYLGKLLSSVVVSYLAPPILFLLSYLLFGVWPLGDVFVFIALTLPLAVFSAGIGIIAGAVFRNAVFIVPVAALGAIFYWITGGGIAPLELVGVGFGTVNEYLPISNVYRSLIRMFVEGSYSSLFIDLGVISIFAVLLMIISPIVADRFTQMDFTRNIRDIKNRRNKHRTIP